MKWIMAVMVGLAALLAAYLLLFEAPPKEPAETEDTKFTVPDIPADTAQAESVYRSNCLGCHGSDYQGGVGTALTNVGATMSKEGIYNKILKGGGGMPPFEDKLSEDEIINLTNWLATFK